MSMVPERTIKLNMDQVIQALADYLYENEMKPFSKKHWPCSMGKFANNLMRLECFCFHYNY